MAEPDDLIPTLLREMRRGMDERFDKVDAKLAEHDKQFDTIRQAFKSETILARYAVSEVDDRLEAIEKRLDAIEARS